MTQQTDRDPKSLYATGVTALEKALAAATAVTEVESALAMISSAAWKTLGDANAATRPGALKDGEHQFSVSGFFMLSPDRTENILIAEHGFPAEQHRLRIASDLGHPGWVTENEAPLLLSNTDEHADFKQILKTARMGSAMYSPLAWDGRFLGQLITASQARGTYDEDDHALHRIYANAAAAVFEARGGEAFVAGLFEG